MRIGFDAKRAFLNRSGLGSYSRDAIRILAGLQPDNNYFAYSPSKENRTGFALPAGCQLRLPQRAISKAFSSYWRSRWIKRDLQNDGIDLYHGLSNEIPVGLEDCHIRSVVTIHDLIFLLHPEFYKPADRWIYKQKFTYSAHHADLVIAVSEHTRQDIIRLLKVPEEKVRVVYQGCSPDFRLEPSPDEMERVSQKYQLPAAYMLCVGTLEKRKNQLALVKAVHKGKLDFPLVFVGRPTGYLQEIKQYVAENKLQNIFFLHQVSGKDLPLVYRGASLFLYPSQVEGFGIPVLEALTAGIPVITSAGTSMEEAGGDGSLYIDPSRPEEIAEAMRRLLDNPALVQRMIDAGKMYADRFSDEQIASNLVQLYNSLM